MDDREIEELLRESWKPEPPAGMRERVLAKARDASARKERRFVFLSPRAWLVAASAAAVVILAFTNVSDHARQQRLAEMLDGSCGVGIDVASAPSLTYRDWQREVDRILAE